MSKYNGDAIKALHDAMIRALTDARAERSRARELMAMADEHEELARQLLSEIDRLEEKRRGH